MDLSKAKRLGELAEEIEALELAFEHSRRAQSARAWVVKIVATDEAECERSIDFNLPEHKKFIADLQVPPEAQNAYHRALKAERDVVIENSARIFAVVQDIIAEKLRVKREEIETL